MDYLNFSFPNLLALSLSILILFLIWLGINAVADTENNSLTKFTRWFYFYLLGITFFCIVTGIGFFSITESFPPRFALFFIFNFFFLFLLLSQRVNGNLHFIANLPPHWLIVIQSFRIFLEIIIFLLYKDQITPREITFTGRSFDLLVGFAALPVAYFVWKKVSWKLGIAFNIFGLLSLINIVSIAILSFPTPFRVYDINYLPTYFPGVLIPLLVAPIAIFLHVLSLKQLFYNIKVASNS